MSVATSSAMRAGPADERTASSPSRTSSASCAVCCRPTRRSRRTPRKSCRSVDLHADDARLSTIRFATSTREATPSTRRSEFVCFVTEEAAGRCAEEKRKTINGDDLIFALQNLGFEEYVPPLQSYLAQYRRVSKQKEKE